jgi:hypothetical protein
MSTPRLLPATNGARDNQHMVDTPDFPDRLDAALAMHGLDNATFAAYFGPTGQQLVNGWRRRGRVGTPNVKRVREILALTDMDWLQEGVGSPERLSGVAEPVRNYDLRQSYAARLDAHILAKALGVMDADEARNGRYSPLKRATLVLSLCDRLAAGEKQHDLIAEIFNDGQNGGSNDGKGKAGRKR